MTTHPSHIESRTIVIERLRVLFVPVPKAACTSVLQILAELAGIPADRFADSHEGEVTPSMSVHDVSRWDPGTRLADYTDGDRDRVLTEPGWFRFTIVREPASRLWSAWQSKVLLREPQFVARFGDRPWFADPMNSPDEVLTRFREFCQLVADPDSDADDVHWCIQSELLPDIAFDHVGRVETFDATMAALRSHLEPQEVELPAARRENRMPLPYTPAIYDAASHAAMTARFAADFTAFGYDVPELVENPNALKDWRRKVNAQLAAVHEIAERNVRIGQLHRTLRGVDRARGRAEKSRDRLQDRVKKQTETLTDLREIRKRREERIKTMRTRVDRQQQKIRKLEAQLVARTRDQGAAQARLDSMMRSRSWRVTKPVRYVGRMVKRISS
jgi:hypothetical protein